MKPLYVNHLSMRHDPIGIPYHGDGVIQEDDGEANYCFKNAKSHPDVLLQVPELVSDAALMDTVVQSME